jgi:hypothetical protein
MRHFAFASVLALSLIPLACSSDTEPSDNGGGADDGTNPFLEDQSNRGKEDSAYMNPDGIEVEVDLEADVTVSSSWRLKDAPADLGQFALTYLRKRGEFYIESLAEAASSDQRVEWLVDGAWLTAAEAGSVSSDKLTHFRIRGINAVLLHSAAEGVKEGTEFKAVVPMNPYDLMSSAGDKCADPDGHMDLSQSVYWYLWNPDRSGCEIPKQDMKLTVSKMFAPGPVTYLEYDKLVADKKVTAVVLFGQIGDDPLTDNDPGVWGLNRMVRWLGQAGFTEVTPAPVGKRFTKRTGEVDFEIDLYSPYDFAGLSDSAHFSNFQKALSEHEIVAYDGHSMLGASDFWSRPEYPDFYQVFLYGGCLGYEYYVQPILGGKGGWENLDIMSSVIEVTADANRFAGPFLAKLAWALENGYAASWRDMLGAVRQSVGDSTFGASGVRDNCFTPTGSLCTEEPDPTTTTRYDSTSATPIPDNDASGATSSVEVGDSFVPTSVAVELNVSHSWVGDLVVTLEHGGASATLWNKTGGGTENIRQTFQTTAFAGLDASGPWTLKVVDTADKDTGTLDSWALLLTK